MAVKKASKQPSQPSTLYRVRHWLRLTSIGLLIAISLLSLTAFTAVHWAEKQVLNADNWVAFVQPLPKQPVIYNALSSYVTTQLFSNVPVEQRIADALPPKAAFLSKPLTDQLNKVVLQTTQRVFSSDAFQTVWTAANRVAINRLLDNARNPDDSSSKVTQKFNVDLSGGNGLIREKLGNIAPTLFENNPNATKHVSITANLKARQQQVHEYIRAMDFLNKVLPMLAAASLLGALALSRSRRRLTIVFASVVAVIALLQVIGIKALRPEILNQLQTASFKPAVGYVYDVLTKSFNHGAYVLLAAALFVLVICVLAGKAAWAIRLRGYVNISRLQTSQPMAWWHQVRQWAGQYKYYVWGAIVALGLVYLAFLAKVSWQVAINTSLAALGLIAITYIVGSPPKILKPAKR